MRARARAHVAAAGRASPPLATPAPLTSPLLAAPSDFTSFTGHVWTHNLLVVVPDRPLAHPDAAALWITGGGNGGPPNQAPDASDEDVLVCASLAVTVGTVCSVLYQIPNADIVFAADPLQKARGEDALVAFTWAQYMLHDRARPEWLAYFPMAKAGIKAMDATTCVRNGRGGAARAHARPGRGLRATARPRADCPSSLAAPLSPTSPAHR